MSPTLHDGDVVLARFGGPGRDRATWCSSAGRPVRGSFRSSAPSAPTRTAGGCSATTRSAPPTRARSARRRCAASWLARLWPRPRGACRHAAIALRAAWARLTPVPAAHSRYRHPVPDRPPRSAAHPRPDRAVAVRHVCGPYPWPRCATITADRTHESAPVTLLSDLQPSVDEIFAAHEGGKLSIGRRCRWPTPRDLSIAYTPGRGEGQPRDRERPRARRPLHLGRTGWWPWSATAPRCSASATSAPAPRCR